jgi:hypothetical protein
MGQEKIENAYYREMMEKQMHEDFLTGDPRAERDHWHTFEINPYRGPKWFICECGESRSLEDALHSINAMRYAEGMIQQVDQAIDETCMCFNDPNGYQMTCAYHAFKNAATT